MVNASWQNSKLLFLFFFLCIVEIEELHTFWLGWHPFPINHMGATFVVKPGECSQSATPPMERQIKQISCHFLSGGS
jgi:hypothetical protein